MRKAFTLVEITLALGVLTTGVLAVVGLYAFGFRESQQSREDIGATAIADIIFSQLTAAVSDPELKWSDFDRFKSASDGWRAYLNGNNTVVNNPTALAQSAFAAFADKIKPSGWTPTFPSAELEGAGLVCGLVINRDEGSGVVRFSFRAVSNPKQLMASPLFYGTAKFMGARDTGEATKK